MKSILLVVSIFTAQFSIAQMFIPPQATGFIIVDNRILGTGFILNNVHFVVTCAHVVDSGKIISFLPSVSNEKNQEKPHLLKLLAISENYDLALFESTDSLCKQPWYSDSSYSVHDSDYIVYIGFRSKMYADTAIGGEIDIAKVAYQDTLSTGNYKVPFIAFNGRAIPGYSGGPVIRYPSGKVIAIIDGGYIPKKGEQLPKEYPNYAFSIESIAEIQQTVQQNKSKRRSKDEVIVY